MKRFHAVMIGFLFCVVTMADLKILATSGEFKQLIKESTVPVVVQFSAYWCSPCQKLKATLIKVAADYSDSEVILAYVDAYENSDLQFYLAGGYPTVRTFSQGSVTEKSFVGNNTESYVRSFINSVIGGGEFCPVL